jgi:pyruvate ferredoxin oxidoreductase alpha subunit/phenylglyoxylate dehydrogenase alpha subunit
MVMAIANREMISPVTVWSGLQDTHSVRDAGWIHLYAESNQEILDSIIQGYMIAEHPDVMIPVHVCYDGFYLSHQSAVVSMPDQEQVDAFLPAPNVRQMLDVNAPCMVDGNTPGDLMMEYREDHLWSMKQALSVIEQADAKFAEVFGRSYGGLLDTYRLEDADEVLVVIGALSGAAKDAVDDARSQGRKVGLIRVRCLRPFPSIQLGELLAGRKAVGVVDKSVNFGWSSGIVYQEVLGALGKARLNVPTLSAVGGLGGADIRKDHVARVIDLVHECAQHDKSLEDTVWLRPDMLQD